MNLLVAYYRAVLPCRSNSLQKVRVTHPSTPYCRRQPPPPPPPSPAPPPATSCGNATACIIAFVFLTYYTVILETNFFAGVSLAMGVDLLGFLLLEFCTILWGIRQGSQFGRVWHLQDIIDPNYSLSFHFSCTMFTARMCPTGKRLKSGLCCFIFP